MGGMSQAQNGFMHARLHELVKLRAMIRDAGPTSRELSLALTSIQQGELWLAEALRIGDPFNPDNLRITPEQIAALIVEKPDADPGSR